MIALLIAFFMGFVACGIVNVFFFRIPEKRDSEESHAERLAEVDRVGAELLKATSKTFEFRIKGNEALAEKWKEESIRLRSELMAI